MFEPGLFKDHVAVITGGGTGLGLAIARRLGSLGARVAIASRNSVHLERGCAALRAAGVDALAVQLDVRNPEQVDEMVVRTVKHFGGIDILVNNAAGNFICRAEDLSPNGWNAVIGIVLNGSFYCSRAVGQYMIARKRGGSIVSILANYVWTGSPGTIHSAAAKAGVMSMTQTLAVEWAPPRHPGQRRRAGADRSVAGRRQATLEYTGGRRSHHRHGSGEAMGHALRKSPTRSPSSPRRSPGFITGEVMTVDGGTWIDRGTFDFIDPGPSR